MQTTKQEWKLDSEPREIGHQPVPMFQALPPQPEVDPEFIKHLMEAETEKLKVKLSGMGPVAEPKPHDEPIKHKHGHEHEDEANKEAFRQLREIFTWIQSEALKRLIALNDALIQLNRVQDQEAAADEARKSYDRARQDFDQFVTDLDNPHPPNKHNGVTMKWATIQPDVMPGGFIRGAKVIVRWAGGSHISSSSLP
jgi:hypothetical protein